MAKSPQPFTIFYAWQSDRSAEHCRGLIRDALDAFADRMNESDELPYRIVIDQDTQNEPGLCDIPATLLAKIDRCGAFVADMSYVSKTQAIRPRKPKLCPNPNVLFELGYAFHTIGPARIVCVMNEVHGPRGAQIFDLGHRKMAIAYESPSERSREEIVAALSVDLETELRPIIARGPRSTSGFDLEQHERERAGIEALVASRANVRGRDATITYCLCPSVYQESRFGRPVELEQIMRVRAHRQGYHEFPPQQKGTADIADGIYNDLYGQPWALTSAGQFWMRVGIAVDWEGPEFTEFDRSCFIEQPKSDKFQAGEWISFETLLRGIYDTFMFMGSLAGAYHDAERLGLSVLAEGLGGKWIAFPTPRIPDHPMGPAVSSTYPRRLDTTAGELKQHWQMWAREIAVAICGLFSRDGRRISDDTIEGWFRRFQSGGRTW